MKRREFLAYGASLASLAAVDSLGLQVHGAFGIPTFRDLRRLSDPTDVPGPVDNMVDYFYAVLMDYGEAANRVSPGDLFGAVAKQTATIDALRRSSGSSAHRLLEVEDRPGRHIAQPPSLAADDNSGDDEDDERQMERNEGIVISGGNIEPTLLARLLTR